MENKTRLADHQEQNIGVNQVQLQVMGASRLVQKSCDDFLALVMTPGNLSVLHTSPVVPHKDFVENNIRLPVFRQMTQQLAQQPNDGDRHDDP